MKILDVLREEKYRMQADQRHAETAAAQKWKSAASAIRHASAPVSPYATISAAVRSGRGTILPVKPDEIRWRTRKPDQRADIIFVVDTSRSEGFQKRLSFVKSAVLAILGKAYQKRDRVAVVTFGNRKAEKLLDFTTSVELAADAVTPLKAAGNTPLAMGLRVSAELFEHRKNKGKMPFMILLTDGHVNYDSLSGDPWQLCLDACNKIACKGIPALLVDTDNRIFSMGYAQILAEAMDAIYVRLT